MNLDPVAKFFSLTGRAAGALAELERVGKRRVQLEALLPDMDRQAKMAEADLARMQRRSGPRAADDEPDPLDEARAHAGRMRRRADDSRVQLEHLRQIEAALLREYDRAQAFEARLRDELQSRGML